MLIPLNQIKSSPHPIRSSWNEDEMKCLVESIKTQGLIVPIKVRSTGDHQYEVIYGHRRAEACRRAGLLQISAFVEDAEDISSLRQSLTENKIREDMSDIDVAKALASEKEQTGETNEKIGERYGWSDSTVGGYLSLLKDEKIKKLAESQSTGITFSKLMETKVALKNPDDIVAVLEKTVKENLGQEQTRKVAEAYAAATSPEEKKAVLETPINNPYFDRTVRIKTEVKKEIQAEKEKKHQEQTKEVGAYMEALKTFEKEVMEAIEAAEFHKFSPEAARYTINRHSKIMNILLGFNQILEGVE
jgi:ParB family chromosome partitioning protein